MKIVFDIKANAVKLESKFWSKNLIYVNNFS